MATGQVALSRHRTPVSVPKSSRQIVPAFLQKLHEMVNDPNNAELIRWSEAGDSFYVLDHERFAREVLGRWFKHQNFASFVRQLNMYGFHKIPHLQQGVLRSDTDTEFWNFAHANFHRGQPDLLCLIQRKKQAAQPGDEAVMDIREATNATPAPPNQASGQVVDIHSIVNGIAAIKRHQSTISTELNELKRSNQLLWQDAMDARAKHQKQQDTINRIVKFLAGVFGNRASPHKEDVVDSSPSRAVVPRRRSRFMIEDGRSGKVTMEDEEDVSENGYNETNGQPAQDPYPTIETPQSTASPALSPAPQDHATPQSTYFSAYPNTTDTPPLQQSLSASTDGERASATLNQTPATSGSQTFHLPDVMERSVTPTRPAPSNLEFDPRIQVVLNQLTPSQIQQLLSSLSHTMEPLPATDHPQSSSSQITQYTPPMDLFSQFMNPLSPPLQPAPVDTLLSFDDHDNSLPVTDDTSRIAKSWKDTDDIDRDVSAMSTDIDTFIRGLGLDPTNLASGSSASSPSASSLHTDQEDAHTDLSLPDETRPEASDSHPPPDPMFDIDSFFDQFSGNAANSSMDYSSNETFPDIGHGSGNLESSAPPPTLPPQPGSLPQLHETPNTTGPTAKRKSDASDLVSMMTDANTAPPPKTSKRRRNK